VELAASQSFLKKQVAYHHGLTKKLQDQGTDPAEIPDPDKAALTDLCHSLFNSNEFVYID
jgi:hypothetical protein